MGKARGVGEQPLDFDAFFAVGPKLGNDVCNQLIDVQFAVLNQEPAGGGSNRLGRREHVKQGVVGGIAEGAQCGQFAIAGDGHLRRGQNSVVHFLGDPLAEGFQFVWVDAYRFWIGCDEVAVEHGGFPVGLCASFVNSGNDGWLQLCLVTMDALAWSRELERTACRRSSIQQPG